MDTSDEDVTLEQMINQITG